MCLKSIVMKINNLIKVQNLLQLKGQINQKLRYTSITNMATKLILLENISVNFQFLFTVIQYIYEQYDSAMLSHHLDAKTAKCKFIFVILIILHFALCDSIIP